jgi:hypothetical protein
LKKYYFFAGLALAGLLGFPAYYFYNQPSSDSVWALIPEKALLAAEVRKPVEILQSQPAWQDFVNAAGFSDFQQRIQTFARQNPDFQQFISKNPVTFSLHATSQRNFDLLFYIPLSPADEVVLNKMLSGFEKNPAFRSDLRIFDEMQIREISSRENPKQIFSMLRHKHFLIAGFTPFLVEDAVRTIQSHRFFTKSTWKTVINPDKKNGLTLYLSAAGLSAWSRNLAREGMNAELSGLADAFQNAQFQMEPVDNQIVLFGYTQTAQPEKPLDFLSIFRNQTPQPLNCTRLSPENTALVYHYGFSDGRKWYEDLQKFWQQKYPEQIIRQKKFTEEYNFSLDSCKSWIGNEIAVGRLESISGEDNRFCLIQTKNKQVALHFLDEVAKNIDLKMQNLPFSDNYAGFPLREIHEKDFPATCFGNLASGFEQCFYTQTDDFLLLANNLTSLKNTIDAIQSGNTWAKTRKGFLSKIQEKSSFSLLMNTPQAWSFLPNEMNPVWQGKLLEKAVLWKSFSEVALQIQASPDGNFQTSGVAFYEKSTTREKLLHKFFVNWSRKLDTTISSAPALFRNRSATDKLFLLQDQASQLYCVDENGKVKWKKMLHHPLESPVQVVEQAAKNQSAAVLAVENELFALGEKGENLPNFPFQVPTQTGLQYAAVLDYEGKKDYRFAVSDKSGNVFLYTPIGKRLEGWNPKRTTNRFSQPLRHLRVGGKDWLLGLQQNGTLQAWNRKGQNLPGFPIALNERISSTYFCQPAPTAADTRIFVLTDGGELVQFSLEGKITDRKQFYRTSRESVFGLCVAGKEKDFFIVRQDAGNVSILDKQAKTLLSKDLGNLARNAIVQYFDFGADTRLFFITQPTLKKTFLFQANGEMLGEGFANQTAVSAFFVPDLNKLLIYSSYGREMRLTSVKIR